MFFTTFLLALLSFLAFAPVYCGVLFSGARQKQIGIFIKEEHFFLTAFDLDI